jgi:hypothetical protein
MVPWLYFKQDLGRGLKQHRMPEDFAAGTAFHVLPCKWQGRSSREIRGFYTGFNPFLRAKHKLDGGKDRCA